MYTGYGKVKRKIKITFTTGNYVFLGEVKLVRMLNKKETP